MKLTSIIITILLSSSSWACQFTVDCQVGSTCVKQGFSLEGTCNGGISPGNDNDDHPFQSGITSYSGTGKECSFDSDCGIGLSCVKSDYSISGTCN